MAAMSIDIDSIPNKPRFRLNEVCELTDTQPYVLRFWESEFDQLNPDKGKGGQPVYRRADIEVILKIKELLYEQELTISDAREALDSGQPIAPAGSAAKALSEEPTEEPPAPAPAKEAGSVSRDRYEDALEEIGTLRLRVEELERALTAAQKSTSPLEGDAWPAIRDRMAAIADRLEAN